MQFSTDARGFLSLLGDTETQPLKFLSEKSTAFTSWKYVRMTEEHKVLKF